MPLFFDDYIENREEEREHTLLSHEVKNWDELKEEKTEERRLRWEYDLEGKKLG